MRSNSTNDFIFLLTNSIKGDLLRKMKRHHGNTLTISVLLELINAGSIIYSGCVTLVSIGLTICVKVECQKLQRVRNTSGKIWCWLQ